MRRLASLVRVGLKANFGLSILHYRIFKEKKDRWLIPLVALAFKIPAVQRFVDRLFGIILILGKPKSRTCRSASPSVRLIVTVRLWRRVPPVGRLIQ